MLKEMVKLFKHEVLDDPNFSSTLSSSPQTHAFCILLFSLEKTQPLQPLDSSKSKISPHKTHNAFTHTPIFSIPIPTLHAEASQSSSPCGEVHVIAGPMFAGKTTTLLRRIQAESNNARPSSLDVIGIDEAQFFEDLYDFCCEAADNDGKTVIIAALDGDFLRRSFRSVLDIIPLAGTVMKLTARCELRGKRAFFTLRKTDVTNRIDWRS